MAWILPTPVLLRDTVAARSPLRLFRRRLVLRLRCTADAFGITIAVAVATAMGRLALWWIEQRR